MDQQTQEEEELAAELEARKVITPMELDSNFKIFDIADLGEPHPGDREARRAICWYEELGMKDGIKNQGFSEFHEGFQCLKELGRMSRRESKDNRTFLGRIWFRCVSCYRSFYDCIEEGRGWTHAWQKYEDEGDLLHIRFPYCHTCIKKPVSSHKYYKVFLPEVALHEDQEIGPEHNEVGSQFLDMEFSNDPLTLTGIQSVVNVSVKHT